MGSYTFTYGRVLKLNGNGFQVLNLDEDRATHGMEQWLNVSRYAKPAPQMPAIGQHVLCSLDSGGFVRSIKIADPPASEQRQPVAAEQHQVQPPLAVAVAGKDLRITRLACLNTATAIIAGAHGGANPDEVIELAARLEAWALR